LKIFGYEIKKIKKEQIYERCDYCPYWNFEKKEYRVWSDEYADLGYCKKIGKSVKYDYPICKIN